jgi:Na+/pantothenate symporter
VSRLWAAFFLGSAAAYAYTLPVVLLGLWQVPAAADAAKLAALVYFLGRLR